MRRSVKIGPVFLSWGDDLHTDDTSFYGVAVLRSSLQWVFAGLSVDRSAQLHRDERMRLRQALESFVTLGLLKDSDVSYAMRR